MQNFFKLPTLFHNFLHLNRSNFLQVVGQCFEVADGAFDWVSQSVQTHITTLDNCQTRRNNPQANKTAQLSLTNTHDATHSLLAGHAECAIARPSIGPFVTRVDQSKMAEVRIMQFSPHSSPIHLILWNKFYPLLVLPD